MKKLVNVAIMATLVIFATTAIFVGCKKDENKVVTSEQKGVKQQKMGNFPMDEFSNLLYSHDGVNFFDENGAEIPGIRVDFEEANRKADIGINENGHEYIIVYEGEGDNCGNAIVWNDETGMSWEALYAICPDGRIIIEFNIESFEGLVLNMTSDEEQNTYFFSENVSDYEWTRIVNGEIQFDRAKVHFDEAFNPVTIEWSEDSIEFRIITENEIIFCTNLEYSENELSFNYEENSILKHCSIYSSRNLTDVLSHMDLPIDFPIDPTNTGESVDAGVVVIVLAVAGIATAIAIHHCQQQIANDVEKCHAKGCRAIRGMCSATCDCNEISPS